MSNPAEALTDQFLAWIADGGRSYGEVMDAWRTSCPRLSIWEDALGDGFVQIRNRPGGTREQALVTITEHGLARLRSHAEPQRTRSRPSRFQPTPDRSDALIRPLQPCASPAR